MSMDTVDDLHATEDENGVLRSLLEEVTSAGDAVLNPPDGRWVTQSIARERLKETIAKAKPYLDPDRCRPSCGAEGDPYSEECDDDSCGCPCDHVEKLDAIPPRERRLHEYLVEHADDGHAEGHLDGCTVERDAYGYCGGVS